MVRRRKPPTQLRETTPPGVRSNPQFQTTETDGESPTQPWPSQRRSPVAHCFANAAPIRVRHALGLVRGGWMHARPNQLLRLPLFGSGSVEPV